MTLFDMIDTNETARPAILPAPEAPATEAPATEAAPPAAPTSTPEMPAAPATTSDKFADELRENVIAIELSFQRVGRRRSMNERQHSEVADHFGAQRRAVAGSKQLYAPNQPEIKKIHSVLSEVRAAWINYTLSYPKKGVRLMRKQALATWQALFDSYKTKLAQALQTADEHRAEIIAKSAEFLGPELFNPGDYPTSFAGSISINWTVYNFEPSDELLKLAPKTYAAEQARVRRQFEEAVAGFEEESRDQLGKLVEALLAKLSSANAGEKVKYTESAANNLREFFDRFESLNIRSDEALTNLVETAKQALGGTTMADLKKSAIARGEIASRFGEVASKLGELVAAAPERSISLEDLD